ncbi:hypothetical protein Kpol_472p1 [Vanderwaltozyma polyspora DSM 70294]|uniref:1-acyl-sn-glycerol-3-phosphate acyltransferase n=1 Tax=Vanderwaltozyma polyspora (strain ATCC 22028 / DSM 70294 / BCRC 21397 / CBS 2163 / NBRC 10782 / NRRL Y-8283 / UCD 57-17) TaxID=436907 RepID=A7TQG9_VANPO|nr:uncharacterized protein Kpol_472p1 [Vanderwaltozyma polyspora DSM 70294]EDO15470.1 hypothetical protein Kpol_472p1 [Vanderwaltozyma polyspora DSM 70294]
MSVGSSIVYNVKTGICIFALGFCAILGMISSILLSLIGYRHISQFVTTKTYYTIVSALLGVEVKVINEKNLDNQPCIYVCNHQSSLDAIILGKLFPPGCTITAKKSLKYVPILGWFLSLSGTLLIDRKNTAEGIATLNKSLEELVKHKRSLWIFAEGTRSYSESLDMLPFKKGAFHLALQGKIPIVPIVVSNTSNLQNGRYHIFNRGTVVVKVLDPIPTTKLTKDKVGEFSEMVHNKMLNELRKNVGYSQLEEGSTLPPKFDAKKIENKVGLDDIEIIESTSQQRS